jgi:hypothetical protein
MGSAYVRGTQALSVLMVVVGIALVVSTLVRGGGPLAFGLIFGVLLLALGIGRLYLSRRLGGTR